MTTAEEQPKVLEYEQVKESSGSVRTILWTLAWFLVVSAATSGGAYLWYALQQVTATVQTMQKDSQKFADSLARNLSRQQKEQQQALQKMIEDSAKQWQKEQQATTSPFPAELPDSSENQNTTAATSPSSNEPKVVAQVVKEYPMIVQQDPAAFDAQIARIETASKTLEEKITAATANWQQAQASHASATIIIAMTQLREGVESTLPYAEKLSSLTSQLGEQKTLQEPLRILQRYAATGVSSRSSLQEEWPNLSAAIVRAANREHANDNTMAWLKAATGEFFTVRRVGATVKGTTAEAIIARAETSLHHNDLATAIKELQTLTGDAITMADPWIVKAQAILATENALAQLTAHITHVALSDSTPAQDGAL